MKSNNEFNDEFDILRDFKRHIKDDNLAHNIFNSYGTEECIININDIIYTAPAYGIYPKYEDIVVGKTANQDIEKDTPITWNLLS